MSLISKLFNWRVRSSMCSKRGSDKFLILLESFQCSINFLFLFNVYLILSLNSIILILNNIAFILNFYSEFSCPNSIKSCLLSKISGIQKHQLFNNTKSTKRLIKFQLQLVDLDNLIVTSLRNFGTTLQRKEVTQSFLRTTFSPS